MAVSNPYKSYKENSIKTACPEELVILMYSGLEKYIKQGQIFIDEKNYEKANEVLLKAQDIVKELTLSLNMEIDLSNGLYSLYDYVLDCLMESNVKKENLKLNDALKIVKELKGAWEGALMSVRQLKYGK